MENRNFSLDQLAIILTLMDKELHMATYFDSIRSLDDHYSPTILLLMAKMFHMIPSDKMVNFFTVNPHLEKTYKQIVDAASSITSEEVMEAIKSDVPEQF